MGVDIQAVICPQCGSTEVDFSSDTTAVCQMCGTQIVISPEKPTADTIISGAKDKDGIDHFIICPQYTEEDFIKGVWIGLSGDETPEDIFSATVSAPGKISHIVVQDNISVDVHYTVSVGYDREEPYTTTEKYYDKDLHREASRVVTKYKKVTDWSPLSGVHSLESTVFNESTDAPFHESDFLDDLCAIPDSDENTIIAPPPGSREYFKNYRVSAALDDAIMKNHAANLNVKLAASLPGDHYKDLVSDIDCITARSTAVYWTSEYETQISYHGKNYHQHAYPFGKMGIHGSDIGGGLDEWQAASWAPVKTLSYLLMGALLASVLVSCFVPVAWLVITAFVASLGLFIYHRIKVARVEADVLSKRQKRKTEALNRKLRSLGYAEATNEELIKWRGYI